MCLHGMEAALELEGARPLCRVPGLSQRWSVSCKTSMLFIFSTALHTKEAAGK